MLSGIIGTDLSVIEDNCIKHYLLRWKVYSDQDKEDPDLGLELFLLGRKIALLLQMLRVDIKLSQAAETFANEPLRCLLLYSKAQQKSDEVLLPSNRQSQSGKCEKLPNPAVISWGSGTPVSFLRLRAAFLWAQTSQHHPKTRYVCFPFQFCFQINISWTETIQVLAQWEIFISRDQTFIQHLVIFPHISFSPFSSWCYNSWKSEQLKQNQYSASCWFLPDRGHCGHHHSCPGCPLSTGVIHYL